MMIAYLIVWLQYFLYPIHQFWSSFLFCEGSKWYPIFFCFSRCKSSKEEKKITSPKKGKSSFNDQTEVSSVDPSYPWPNNSLFESKVMIQMAGHFASRRQEQQRLGRLLRWGPVKRRRWEETSATRVDTKSPSAWTFIRSMAVVYGWTCDFWYNLYQNTMLCHMWFTTRLVQHPAGFFVILGPLSIVPRCCLLEHHASHTISCAQSWLIKARPTFYEPSSVDIKAQCNAQV